MTYTEKELDQFLHGISLSLLSKKSAQHWRYDEETAKEIEWLEALERKVRADKADRKTENSSEKPNNCEDLQDWKDRMWAEAIVTEPTISKMEQVDKDINVRSKDEPQIFICACETCKHRDEDWNSEACDGCCEDNDHYEPKDEPKTQMKTQNSNLTFEKTDEPQTYVINPQEPTNDDECFECDDFFTCGGQCNKIEDEPQINGYQTFSGTSVYVSRLEDEPQTDNGIGCSRCEGRYDCCDRDMPHAIHCNNYGKITDEPQTDCAWK